MKYGRIGLKGINRSIASQKVPDGWMDELINLRHDKAGNMVPVGLPTKIWNIPLNDYSNIWHHDQDNVDNKVGQNEDNSGLYLIDMSTGAGTLIKAYAESVRVEFLKRFMIVSYSSGMDVFWWNNGVYNLVVMPNQAQLTYGVIDEHDITTDTANNASSLLGNYYKSLNEESADGFLTGGIMFRAAYKMFDGSYVVHTLPTFLSLGLSMAFGAGPYSIKFKTSNIKVAYKKSDFTDINSKLYTSVVIFASKNEELFDVSADTITDDLLSSEVNLSGFGILSFNDTDGLKDNINQDFKNLVDTPSWYKVHEISIDKIQNGVSGSIEETIDMKGFYQDYATKETLPVDQFSHHDIAGNALYNFNSRLHIGDVVTSFGDYIYYPFIPVYLDPQINYDYPSDYTFIAFREVRIMVSINSSNGLINKIITVGNMPFATKSGKEYLIISFDVLGYPDSRANSIKVLVKQGANWFNIKEFTLEKSIYDNYAYYTNPDFGVVDGSIDTVFDNFGKIIIETTYQSGQIININSIVESTLEDQNRVQVSEVNNPLYYPAENSYQVGTGTILAFGTNTEPLSQGQFGQHPMIVFTSKGIYVLLQGSGEILYSAILPLNGEIPNNPDKIVSVSTGVVYTTDEGLYIISGSSVQELSKDLTGRPNLYLQDVENYTARIDHTQFVQLLGSLSTIDAKLYIAGASFGYNYTQKELVVSNPDYDYSYVYSFLSGTWHKISETFKTIIRSYPKLLVLNENVSNSGVFDLTLEQDSTYIDTLLTTRPCKVEEGGSILFTLIHRAILRCELNTGVSTFAGFYVFGSNDLKTWQLFQGSDNRTGEITDLFCLRSHLKVKYFVFVFAANLKEGESFLNELDLQYYHKLTNKIR